MKHVNFLSSSSKSNVYVRLVVVIVVVVGVMLACLRFGRVPAHHVFAIRIQRKMDKMAALSRYQLSLHVGVRRIEYVPSL